MIARLTFAVGLAALAASAQVFIERTLPPQDAGGATFQTGPVMAGMTFISADMAGSQKVVKGAPYSAQIVTEHTQTLADGNTIKRKETGAVYRDSEGRTRREQTLGQIGPLPSGAPVMQLVFINDPVAGVNYVLHADQKTADKMPPPGAPPQIAGGPGIVTRTFVTKDSGQAPQPEPLGTKIIEGVSAEGTRVTFTIPAGQIGNERPIETVTERWYSPQLQATVLTTTDDPRMGQTIYRLVNISLSEPAHSLFEVPADYQVNDGPSKGNVMYMAKPVK